MIASVAACRYEMQRQQAVFAPLDQLDLAASQVLTAYSFLVQRLLFMFCFVVAWALTRSTDHRLLKEARLRLSAGLRVACATAIMSFTFWMDILWLSTLWANADARYQPFALGGTAIYTVGCACCAVHSLWLLFPSCFGKSKLHLDWKVAQSSAWMWAYLVVASWAASPRLLTLLPWATREFGGLPTQSALWSDFAIRSALQSALVALKLTLLLHLSDDGQPVFFTMLLNIVLLVRVVLERTITYAAYQASLTRWARVQVFLSYRVSADSDLVTELYWKLRTLNVCVWWDSAKERGQGLAHGQLWEDSFVDGLLSSQIFIPVWSKEGLGAATVPACPNSSTGCRFYVTRAFVFACVTANFGKLHPDSACDNVLLENVLALEQEARGAVKAICPVLVGSTKRVDDHDTGEGEEAEAEEGHSQRYVHSNFFRESGFPKTDSGRPCTEHNIKAVDEKVLHHLVRHSEALRGREECGAWVPYSREDASKLKLEDRSPSAVLERIKRYQGFLVEGERSRKVAQCAHGAFT
jgi:hypothetical protein